MMVALATVALCFDKFRASATAAELVARASEAAASLGWAVRAVPMSDGGEGLLEILGGANRRTMVPDPLGRPIEAAWLARPPLGVIEMAAASGLTLVGGPEGNDPVRASTAGTGMLVAKAVSSGMKEVVVGVGGSATTDGGLGAVEVLRQGPGLRGVRLRVAVDTTVGFLDAARVFAPQKGASPAVVELLSRRLEALADRYESELGVDVRSLVGAGAGGGLAGGLAALGGELVPGLELVAELVGLHAALAEADAVVTGEGRVDRASFQGKVTGGVAARAKALRLPCLLVAGSAEPGLDVPDGCRLVVLEERYGRERSMAEAAELAAFEVRTFLDDLG
jgi:glycerate kinase